MSSTTSIAGPWDARAVRSDWERFLSTGSAGRSVRNDVAQSWRRSALSGVQPDAIDLPYEPGFDPESRLMRAARPAMTRFEARLAGSDMSVIVADRRSRVVYRWADSPGLLRQLDRNMAVPGFLYGEEVAGTNAIGTAIEHGRTTWIRGEEHFAEILQTVTCVGVPLHHPVTGRLEGVLDLTCHKGSTHPLMPAVVTQVADEICQHFLRQASRNEQRLLEEYVALSRSSRRPVICLSAELLIAGTAASKAFQGADREAIWDRVIEAIGSGSNRADLMLVGSGPTRCSAVVADGEVIGALLELPTPAKPAGKVPAPLRVLRQLVGQGAALGHVEKLIHRYGATSGHVLVAGESGTGKTVIARAVAEQRQVKSPADVRTIEIDAGAEDAFEVLRAADTEAAPAGLTLLLRHVEAAHHDVIRLVGTMFGTNSPRGRRLIATFTSEEPDARPPAELAGIFGAVIVAPPLRFHREDVPELATTLLARHRYEEEPASQEFSADALRALMRHDWPGNVQELDRVITAVNNAKPHGTIELNDLPDCYRDASWQRPLARLEQLELDAIVTALRVNGGSKQVAAEWLGISRATMYRKLRAYRIDPAQVVDSEAGAGWRPQLDVPSGASQSEMGGVTDPA